VLLGGKKTAGQEIRGFADVLLAALRLSCFFELFAISRYIGTAVVTVT